MADQTEQFPEWVEFVPLDGGPTIRYERQGDMYRQAAPTVSAWADPWRPNIHQVLRYLEIPIQGYTFCMADLYPSELKVPEGL
jgi:hypothetical protein